VARLFVSDLHLDGGAPEAIAQFVDFARTHAVGAEALYILGDLFETWTGDDDSDADKRVICRELKGLTDSGVACFALHGNRDFLLGQGFCEATGCVLLTDPVVAEFDGERVLLTHGDVLCTDDDSYQQLRSVVRDPRWQSRFLALPRARREQLMNAARAGSRRHTARIVPTIMDVNTDTVAAAYRSARVRRIIHGHTHRPAIHADTLEGTPVERIVLGAWYEQGSYLRYENGAYELRELPRARGAAIAQA